MATQRKGDFQLRSDTGFQECAKIRILPDQRGQTVFCRSHNLFLLKKDKLLF